MIVVPGLTWDRRGHSAPQRRRMGPGSPVASPEQKRAARDSLKAYEQSLLKACHGPIATEILEAPPFYYAEDDHQQYLAKNPNGYCGPGGTGVSCPIGVTAVT